MHQKESSGEKIIREFLETHNITYQQEKRFSDCRDNKPLPFDFYLPDRNTCIEFDGQQHYEPIYNENRLAICQKHDQIKNNYCEQNNITLIRIPYYEGNNINEILKTQLLRT